MTENGKRKPICPYADRAENLERRNEILETGQRVYDIDNKKSKIGDGEKHWNDLPWESTGGGSSVTIDTEITDSATDANVPSTKAVKTELDKKLDKADAVGKKTAEGGEIFNSYDGEFPNVASGQNSHAEGLNTQATGYIAHAEGAGTIASGSYSHAEGLTTKAIGLQSHAEGMSTKAKEQGSHAEGEGTIASKRNQHVQGQYNIEDTTTNGYAHIVGNGTSDNARSNAHTLDWDGNAWYAGNVTVGGTYNSETGVVDGAKELVDEEVIERIKYYDDPNIIPSDESYFTVNETGETITGLTNTGKTQTELVIPYKINGVEINNIRMGSDVGEDTDEQNNNVRAIKLPNSIDYLNIGAFGGYISLESIDIPSGVTAIGFAAFTHCSSLKSINIPNSVTGIGNYTFNGCSSLTSINIPNSVTSIGKYVFKGCTNLTIYCEQGSYAETYANTNNIPVIYTDVKAITLVGQKTASGGEIFNDYTNNQASAYSHAEGYNTIAGHMGHLITDDGWGDSTSKTYTLTSVDGLAVNDIVSIADVSISNNIAELGSVIYENFAKITAIDSDAKTITVDTYEPRHSQYGVIYVKSKPTVGSITIAAYSHAEGNNTKAYGQYSHAEGKQTEASGSYSHAEGQSTIASGDYSHVEGVSTEAAYVSHAEGRGSKAIGSHSHAEGMFTTASGEASHTEGGSTIVGTKAFVVDIANSSSTDKKYKLDSVSGLSTNDIVYLAYGSSSSLSKSSAMTIKAVDSTNKTITVNTYTTSTSTLNYIVVKDKPDKGTTIIGKFSGHSHAEGDSTYASGRYSHAEGGYTIACGDYSHAEGGNTRASGEESHAEGHGTTASGNYGAHSEGYSTQAIGSNSHAEGHGSMASSDYGTHAEGYYTVATRDSQHVQGKFNKYDTSANGYAHIVGNGTDLNNRSNAHTLDWSGNAWFAGNVTVGGTYNSETGALEGVKELATKEYVDTTAVETSVTDPIVVNTIYSLGEQSSLTIELPTGAFGNFIQFDFISGSTATTLSITSTDGLIGNNLVPNANTIYTLYLDWGIVGYTDSSTIKYGWRLNYFEYPLETF